MKETEFKQSKKFIDLPMFNSWVGVIVATDVKEAVRRTFPDVAREQFSALHVCKDGLLGSYLAFSHSATVNEVTHECMHAVQHLFEVAGIDDDEVEAYLMGFLVGRVSQLHAKMVAAHRAKPVKKSSKLLPHKKL